MLELPPVDQGKECFRHEHSLIEEWLLWLNGSKSEFSEPLAAPDMAHIWLETSLYCPSRSKIAKREPLQNSASPHDS